MSILCSILPNYTNFMAYQSHNAISLHWTANENPVLRKHTSEGVISFELQEKERELLLLTLLDEPQFQNLAIKKLSNLKLVVPNNV